MFVESSTISMNNLGSYGNLSSPWRNIINHQHHQTHEEMFSQQISSMVSQHLSPSNPISVFPNRPYNNMRLYSSSPLMPDFGTDDISKTTTSLDCLLSATNSIKTDISVEDDCVSVVFSPPQQASPHSFKNNNKYNPSSAKRAHDQISQVLSFEVSECSSNYKKIRLGRVSNSSNISFQQPNDSSVSSEELDSEAIQHMKEMMYRVAAFRPVNLGEEIVEKPKRKNVKISNDPQTTAARERRERVGERIRVLQRLVPGGNKMDTASMLDEAANYLKFLKSQVKALENLGGNGQYYYKFDHSFG